MRSKENSSLKAAIRLGEFLLLAVCIGGCSLLSNTSFGRVLSEIVTTHGRSPTGTLCLVTEELDVPFSRGLNGVATQNSYSGPVQITVAGAGQAMGTSYTDAFYVFTDGEGSSISPEHPDDWILTINAEFAHYLIPGEQIPPYNDHHVYTFEINAPSGVLTFGVKDGYAADNSGSYSISICQHAQKVTSSAIPELITQVSGLSTRVSELSTQVSFLTEMPTLTSSPEPVPQATAMPISTASPTESYVFRVGEIVELTSIHMVSETDGWGLHRSTVLITRDGGRTWRDVTPPEHLTGAKPIEAYGAFVDANHAWLLFATLERGTAHLFSCMVSEASVVYTTDGGQTWKASQPLMHDLSKYPCRPSFSMIDTRTGWLQIVGWYTAAGGHVPTQYFHTTDGGTTWNMLVPSWCGSTEDSCYSESTPEWFDSTDMDFVNHRTGWLLRETLDPYAPGPPYYYITTDGGLSWKAHILPAPLDAPDLFDRYQECEPYQLNLLTEKIARLKIACSKNFEQGPGSMAYVYATEDGGITWNSYQLPLSAADVDEYYRRMLFFDADHGLLLGREMWRTADGGKTWQHINTVTWNGQFSFVDRWRGWAVAKAEGATALVYTLNGGMDWLMLNPVGVP